MRGSTIARALPCPSGKSQENRKAPSKCGICHRCHGRHREWCSYKSVRAKPIARSPVKKRPRPASETERIYGPPERRAWVKQQPSVASGNGPCENAHIETGGMGYKADCTKIVPLTRHEHRVELHAGRAAFEAKYGIDLDVEAAAIEAKWQARAGGAW